MKKQVPHQPKSDTWTFISLYNHCFFLFSQNQWSHENPVPSFDSPEPKPAISCPFYPCELILSSSSIIFPLFYPTTAVMPLSINIHLFNPFPQFFPFPTNQAPKNLLQLSEWPVSWETVVSSWSNIIRARNNNNISHFNSTFHLRISVHLAHISLASQHPCEELFALYR